uniref:Centrosomal protein of 135 kDa n=1 Tax=Macrostomum lignano TaxID=282301 RepID=A0A1I8HFE0_9PLAT
MSGGEAVSAVEERFTNTRKKLDQLGYRQPLTVEALPLAERLLADLIWTTEHLRRAKQETEKKVEVKSKIEEYIEPYKSDNGKLVKENNELHQELLRLKQKYDEENRELMAAKRRLESEAEDLRFFNSQCLAKLKQMEEESRRKSEKILQLQEKNLLAVVQTPSGKKKSIPYRRQRMEVDELLEPPSSQRQQPQKPTRATPLTGVRKQQQDPHVVDLVKASQKRISELQKQLDRQNEEADIQERRIANLKRAAALREDEIARLKVLCEGGRPYEAVSLEAEARGAERLLHQQAAQIEALSARNRELETALAAAEARIGADRRAEFDLGARNRHLSGELENVGRMAHPIEVEKAEVLAAADAEIAQAKAQLEATRQRLAQLEEACAQLEERQLLQPLQARAPSTPRPKLGGRPYEAVSLEAEARGAERLLHQQAAQIEALSARNRELETALAAAEARIGADRRAEFDLGARNRHLSGELENVGRMAHRIEVEKAEVLAAADAEIAQAKAQLEATRQRLAQLEEACAQLEEDLLLRLQADKKRLAQRVEKLTANERELVLEIERLKRRVGSAKKAPAGNSATTTSQIEQYFKGVESDRDYWKREAEQLSQMLKSPVLMAGRSAGSRGSSPSGGARMSRGGKLRSPSPARPASRNGTAAVNGKDYSSDHGADYVGNGGVGSYETTLRQRGRSPPTRDRDTAAAYDDAELLRVKRERDELQALLDKFERHMAEIQGNVRALTHERDQLARMLDDTKDELHRSRREVMSSANQQPKVSLAAQAVLKRVETERDDAIAELRRTAVERDSLRDRMKAAADSASADRARLEQRIEELQAAARKAAAERDDNGTKAATLRHRCQELEEQAKQLHRALADRDDELANERGGANQARLSLESAQRQCRQLEADLAQAQDAAALLQDRCICLDREVKSLRDEQAQLRAGINNLDYEKDSLEGALQERADRLRAAEEEAKAKEALTADLRAQLHHAEYQLGRAQDQLGNREQELRQVRKASETAQAELASERHRADCLQRDVARLQDDLQVVTRENASLQSEIQDTAQEREQFKSKAQDYLAEVRRVEELLGQKEQERADLLEQYRQLSSESDRFQADAHQLESEGSSLRLELAAKEADCKRLKERLEQAEADLRDCRHTASAYELQLSNLTRSVSDLEDSLRQQELERAETMKDLAALRDLCARLESSKDSVQRQLTSKALDTEQLAGQVDELQHEADLLREQLAAESDAKKSLETVLSASREKEFQTQLEAQERQAELAMLRERLELSDTKLEQLGRDLARFRSRNSELESDVERLTRQLASERFERERLAAELRRTGGGGAGGGGGRGSGLAASSSTGALYGAAQAANSAGLYRSDSRR